MRQTLEFQENEIQEESCRALVRSVLEIALQKMPPRAGLRLYQYSSGSRIVGPLARQIPPPPATPIPLATDA